MEGTANIKEKIVKLLALSDNPNENEAKVALLKARELMAKYKLTDRDIVINKDIQVIQRLTGKKCTKMTNAWAVRLSSVIADNYCCKAYRLRHKGSKTVEIGLIGFEDDIDICERIFKYAYDCVESGCKAIKAKYRNVYEAAYIRSIVEAYGNGFVEGLAKAYKSQQQEHEELGLILVIPKEVQDYTDLMGRPKAYKKVDYNHDNINYAAKGYQDGLKFDPSTKLPQPKSTKKGNSI